MRRLIDWQRGLCEQFDGLLPPRFRVKGNHDFVTGFVPAFLHAGQRVIDVGGGRHPVISPEHHRHLGLHVTGLDISAQALREAPAGSYDATLVADLTTVRGSENADLVICQSVLEHIRPMESALKSMRTLVKPDGFLLLFVPCRNAVFARMNQWLPQTVKRALLFRLFPESASRQGFPAYYDRCSPAEITRLGHENGFQLLAARFYFRSTYFSFWLPLHALWRCLQAIVVSALGNEGAETFALAFRKRA